jgi:Transposase DDE domain
MAPKDPRAPHSPRRPTQQHRRAARQDQQAARRRARRSQPDAAVTNGESLKRLCSWLLPDDTIFARLHFHGNTKWRPRSLVWLALCWSLVDARHLTDAFDQARAACSALLPCALTTYQGFMNALLSSTPRLLPLLRGVLHRRMRQPGSPHWRVEGWLPIAFDGSRSTAPRTRANEAALCAANYGHGATARYRKKKSKGLRRRRNERNKAQPQEPQAWITLLWHMGLRLPWTWRLGPSNSSERGHVLDMLQHERFPDDTLFCGDAGFVGYPLWSCLVARGHHFLVRVGANVKLLSEEADCELVPQGRKEHSVLCWPKEASRAKQPPLRLRLLRVEVGQSGMWLLTNVLSDERLTARLARQFYKMRWGVELEFRGLKQTLDRAVLRSRNDKRLLVELDWSLLAMAVVELLALKEQQQAAAARRQAANPAKRSLAGAVRALRRCLRQLHEVPGPGEGLAERLRAAVTDDYQRQSSKRCRYKRRNPDKKPLGDPKVRPLNPQELLQPHKLIATTAS